MAYKWRLTINDIKRQLTADDYGYDDWTINHGNYIDKIDIKVNDIEEQFISKVYIYKYI